jgi:hypothetical protein
MLKTILLIASALVLTSACAPTPDYPTQYTVLIDPAFDALGEMPQVMEGLQLWEVATGVTFIPVISNVVCDKDTSVFSPDNSDTCHHAFSIHPDTHDDLVSKFNDTTLIGYCRGWSLRNAGSVVGAWSNVYVQYNTSAFAETLQHEVGHALGLVHTGPGTLMCWNTDCSPGQITCDDVQQYRALRGISFDLPSPACQ